MGNLTFHFISGETITFKSDDVVDGLSISEYSSSLIFRKDNRAIVAEKGKKVFNVNLETVTYIEYNPTRNVQVVTT